MRRALRFAVLLLLMAVVPIRGAIGASMVMCGPWHGGDTHASQSEIAPPQHGDHAAHKHTVVPTVVPDDREVGAPAHDHVALGSNTHDPTSTCGLCADCCAGGSLLLSAALTLPVVEQADAPFPPVQVRFERRAPDGLERPPHTLLV